MAGGSCSFAEFTVADAGYNYPPKPEADSGKTAGEARDATLIEGSWRRLQGDAADAGKSRAAILHTMDFERSDPRLAGILLQCGPHGIETVIVVVEPFPPHSQPEVTLRTPEQAFQSAGRVIPAGAGIRLQWDPAHLMALARHEASELEVKVAAGGAAMSGVVALAGLPKALEWLNAECVQK